MELKKDHFEWLLRLILPIATKFLPGWVTAVLMVVIEIVDGLPDEEKGPAKKEIKEAAQRFIVTGDAEPLAGVAKKYHKRYCEGPDCPLPV